MPAPDYTRPPRRRAGHEPMNDELDERPAVRDAAAGFPVLRLKRHEERRVAAGHLWIFSNEVDAEATPLTAFAAGSIAEVRSDRDRFLGYAYVNPHSLIAARILSRDAGFAPGPSLLVHRLKVALALRERLYASPYYRLVHGESDLLPGLVVDRYGDVLVAQMATAGMEAQKAAIAAALDKVVRPRARGFKNDTRAREREGQPKDVEAALGELPEQLTIIEDGLRFTAPLAGGQKTGWFYDQAANRRQFLPLMKGAGRVLDVFSYVGAWAVPAARVATEVTCIDSSAGALEMAARNGA